MDIPLRLKKQMDKIPAGCLPIWEIINTIEGEGPDIGFPKCLVRMGGCAVECAWCDTKYSWNIGVRYLTIDEIEKEIARISLGVSRLSITGGEPLHYPEEVTELINRFSHPRGVIPSPYQEYPLPTQAEVTLETSGAFCVPSSMRNLHKISMDLKPPSSGVPTSKEMIEAHMNGEFYAKTHFKIVIADYEDLMWVEQVIPTTLLVGHMLPNKITLTPCSTVSDIGEIVRKILEWNNNYNIRVIAQQHTLLGYS